jgi:hypothetical protein
MIKIKDMSEEKQLRGQLTERIKQKSLELFGYEITQKELRLLPYVLYEAVNNKLVNNVDREERNILDCWINNEWITVTGIGNILSISEEFFVNANKIVYLGYVDLKG